MTHKNCQHYRPINRLLPPLLHCNYKWQIGRPKKNIFEISLKRSCKMQFRCVGLRLIRPSSQNFKVVATADLWVYNAENFCVSFFYQVTSIFHLRRGEIKKNFGLPNIEPINLYNIVINLFQSDATRLLLSSYTSFLESFTPLRPLASEISSIMPIAL